MVGRCTNASVSGLFVSFKHLLPKQAVFANFPANLWPKDAKVADRCLRASSLTASSIFAPMALISSTFYFLSFLADTPEFHNIHYVREMLRQVLTALDRAERETGFFHADLGQRNVMEHYPDLFEDEAVDQQRRAVEAEALGKEYHPQGDARKVAYETTPGAAPSGQGTRAPMDASPAPSGGEGSQHGTSPPRPVAGSGAVHVTVSSRVKPERIPTEAGERTIPSSPFAATAAGPYCLRPGHVRPRPGYSCNADGGRMPLGPRVEFKIIDYGSSIFSPTLAEATGGFRARKNYREMQKLFEADHVEFRSKSHRMINVSTAMRGDPNGGQDSWKLMPTRLKQRVSWGAGAFRFLFVSFWVSFLARNYNILFAQSDFHWLLLREIDFMALVHHVSKWRPTLSPAAVQFAMTSVPKSKSFVDLERSSSADAPERLEAGHLGHLHASLSLGEERAKQAAAAQEAAATKPPKAPPQPRMGPIEKMYRQFWRRKGDVFHLLLGLALALDDRVWPKEDQEQVQLFATLIYHVTGVCRLHVQDNAVRMHLCCFGRVLFTALRK